MALFMGLQDRADSGKQDAENAVRAALELRAAFDKIVTRHVLRWQANIAEEISLGLGCGIHTGDALVGSLGLEFHNQFTALGHNVNIASRLQTHAGAGEVLVSQTTLTRLGKAFRRGEERLVDVRNIPGKFRVCPILGLEGGTS